MPLTMDLSDPSDDEFPALDALLRQETGGSRSRDRTAEHVQETVDAPPQKTKKPSGLVRRRRLNKNVTSVSSQPLAVSGESKNNSEERGARHTKAASYQQDGAWNSRPEPSSCRPKAPVQPGTFGEQNASAHKADVAPPDGETPSQPRAYRGESKGRSSRGDSDLAPSSSTRGILPSISGSSMELLRLPPPGKRGEENNRALISETGRTSSGSGLRTRRDRSSGKDPSKDGLESAISKLHIHEVETPPKKDIESRPETPRGSPSPKQTNPYRPGLVSPKKMPRIPATPHRESSDMFWSQEFVDEWNDEHSPRKQLFPDALSRPIKSSPTKKVGNAAAERRSKKAFNEAKHETAAKFLRELDTVITGSQISDLAAETGGVRIKWTSKLYTTAGRASWKKEIVRSGNAEPKDESGRHRHHASIELAEKVIDDEDRLLNVIAHEFCHLANFMISGVTANPHGKEFKAWAAKCSAAFGHRGVHVTTKHSYEIEFKYVWQCDDCGMEYNRHSKSINTERHRCGGCKGALTQTKPVPRAAGKMSTYQRFMKEQMKDIRAQNLGSPQNEILRLVAEKWSQAKAQPGPTGGTGPLDSLGQLTEVLSNLDRTSNQEV